MIEKWFVAQFGGFTGLYYYSWFLIIGLILVILLAADLIQMAVRYALRNRKRKEPITLHTYWED